MSAARTKQRSGTILICVMTCMLVATTTVAFAVRGALRQRRELRSELQLRQTEWLLDAGVKLAVRRLTESRDYQGETWQPQRLDDQFHAAQVEIKIAAQTDSDRHLVTVTAAIGEVQLGGRTQRSYQFHYPSIHR